MATIAGGRAKPKTRRQDVLHEETVKMIALSVNSLQKAARHPYVLDKFKKCAKPILLTAAIVYCAGLLLVLPIQIIATLLELLSLGNISHSSVAGNASSWVHDTVSLVPFLALLLLRNLMRKPLYKCFIHLLREVNPATAASLELRQAARGEKKSGKGGGLSRTVKKARISMLMALEFSLHMARKSPLLGRPAVVATHFLTMKKAMGRDRAIVLSLFGLVPYVEPWLLRFVQLWRSSNILGQEIVSDFVTACVPSSQRSRFCKEHDVDITVFALPGSLLLQIPVVGPLFFIPIQASAAFLVDKLAHSVEKVQAEGSSRAGVEMQQHTVSPTLPSGPPPFSKS